MRIPQLPSIEKAIQIYYEKTMLFPKDIRAIFECGPTSAAKLRDIAAQRMEEDRVPVWNARAVDTESAYKAWGLDIRNLERRAEKLRRLLLSKEESAGER